MASGTQNLWGKVLLHWKRDRESFWHRHHKGAESGPLTGLCGALYTFSVQCSHSVVSDYLQPHGLQYARPPHPSPTPRVYPNSCPLSRWYHPTISSSVISFSSCLQSLPASGSFPMSQFFTSGSSFNISPSNEYSGLISFRMDWFELLAVQGTLRKSLLQHHSAKTSILQCSAFFIVHSHIHTWLPDKP